MGIAFQYKAPETNAGALRTPVCFYEYGPKDGIYPGEEIKAVLHECFSEVYNPSMKDIEIMKSTDTKEAVTIRIRDTKGEYTPTNKHRVRIDDYRYTDKVFNIVDVRPDLTNNNYITLLLGYTS